jgi:hypothetical protein
MFKSFCLVAVVALATTLSSCGGKASASSVAQKWCDLNAKVYKAPEGAAKQSAEADREKYEKEMQDKYKDDKAFMDEVGKEVEKCEAASEGK